MHIQKCVYICKYIYEFIYKHIHTCTCVYTLHDVMSLGLIYSPKQSNKNTIIMLEKYLLSELLVRTVQSTSQSRVTCDCPW